MTISFPLTLSDEFVRRVVIRERSVVGMSSSRFSFSQQVFVHQGEMWEVDIEFVPMRRADAEPIIAQLTALNGREGTFLIGDPLGSAPRGVGTGTPLVAGGGQTGKVLAIDGLTPDTTGILKAGDWLQLGSGASTRLHKVVADANSDGTGAATLDIWPRLRASPADDDPVTLNNARGIWRLGSNVREWGMEVGKRYQIAFSAVEAL
jgi:hypothetical protein